MALATGAGRCPDCDTALSDEPWATGLCPVCLISLGLEAPSLPAAAPARADAGDDAPTLAFSEGSLSPGQILGARYRVRALLGRGGMGEVWRALDLKLRVEVALKALRPQMLEDERALESLRQEVRSAREVISPNVCRVFDLVELDGRELVSMEYIDGITLADVLRLRAPLELTEAREMASQILAGLEAIHEAGLVHRDLKPENIMITRAGRLVVMDFGIARVLAEERTGTVAGTPAYMAPEQARGEAIDARADVFSAGIVLAEMIAPDGLATHERRAKIWEDAHHEPPLLPDSPWAPVLHRAVAQRREERFVSAAALARALEEVTLRVDAGEDLHPYPGLASFTQQDAEYFFGRELEVEEMWKKLRRPHLLGLIGPSGAGKSSFLRAGLLPVMPTGWRAIVAVPGNRPFTALGEALVTELAGRPDAVKDFLRFADSDVAVSLVARWRQDHNHVLIILDQFEELFTQNPAEMQSRFAELLARLALEADAHVLISMRDDFLFHCSSQPALTPMFSELTPLRPPSGSALRRALVQPALKCGYTFQNEALIDEMVTEVANERGALPLLAFTAARLWDLRDRKRGLLTREAYEHVGGVTGALAQHAEATLERIGQDRLPLVRELFRNLVTAQGTRAARNRDELLSVFPPDSSGEKSAAARVLDRLIEARLLTSYEVAATEPEDAPQQRVEIIHESLLSNWPRLVRWQTQDADSTQLRDQVRQAARLWEERGRPEDLLWTGTSFGEYQLWRERYEGGLSEQEQDFAAAMVSKAERTKRRRRILVGAVIVVLAAGLSIVAGFWWQAERSRQRAEAETLRAEASKVLALAQLEFDRFPTGALAYVRKSLELTDTAEGRRFVERILLRGPVARILPDIRVLGFDLSPDGHWLALNSDRVQLVSSDGRRLDPIGRSVQAIRQMLAGGQFAAGGDALLRGPITVREDGRDITLLERWTFPELAKLPDLRLLHPSAADPPHARGLTIYQEVDGEPGDYDLYLLPDSSFREATPKLLPLGRLSGAQGSWVDPSGTKILFRRSGQLFVRPLGLDGRGRETRFAEGERDGRAFAFSPDATLVATSQLESERMTVWSVADYGREPLLALDGNKSPDPLSRPGFSPDNSRLVMASTSENAVYLWDLETPLDGRPLVLAKGDDTDGYRGLFHPNGRWLMTLHALDVAFWPLDWPHARRVTPAADPRFAWLRSIAFSPDGQWLASCSGWSGLHLWPLETGLGQDRQVANGCIALTYSPTGEEILLGGNGFVALGPVESLEPERLVEATGWYQALAFDPAGRWAAASPNQFVDPAVGARLWVWDLASGEARSFDVNEGCPAGEAPGTACLVADLGFSSDGALWGAGSGGVRRWDLEAGEAEWVVGPDPSSMAILGLSQDGRYMVQGRFEATAPGETSWLAGSVELQWFDLQTGQQRILEGFPGTGMLTVAIDPSGQTVAVGTSEGDVWLGRVTGDQPHRLVGHEQASFEVLFSPDGRRLASQTEREVLVWELPDLDKPPLHTLPLAELLARIDSFTNVRAGEDPDASSGWTLEVGPFPGWRDVPEW